MWALGYLVVAAITAGAVYPRARRHAHFMGIYGSPVAAGVTIVGLAWPAYLGVRVAGVIRRWRLS